MGENPFEPTRGSRNRCSQEFTGEKRRCFPVFPKVDTPYGQALTGLRVLKFDGAIAPRVLKFDSGFAAEGCRGRLTFIEGALL